MKLSPEHQDVHVKTMSDINSSTKGLNSNVSMDRVKKLLSPGTRKKFITNGGNKIFGVPLEELILRATSGCKVPFIVQRICDFLESKGFHHEGIFRVNGNAKVLDKLKHSFDIHGDANLEEEEDIMAVAGILKLFLRELPDSVVPQHMTRQFVKIQEEFKNDSKSCIQSVKQALNELPEEHYNLLKYLLRFLVVVAHNEKTNKMSPMSLAIVFGPNLFRCDQGIGGLKDQGTINQIVFKFIVHYESIFAANNEESPVAEWTRRLQGIAPPRPPPPKLQKEDDSHLFKPVPLPRKSKHENYDSHQYNDHEEWDHSEGSSSTPLGRGNAHSPRFSDDETAGRASPFILDSDGGFSMIESPIPSARTSEAVERVIAMTITEQLFGDEDRSILNSVEFIKDLSNDEGLESTDPGSEDKSDIKSDEIEESSIPIKDRIKLFEKHDSDSKGEASTVPKPEKPRPTSKAFNFFETKGLIITQAREYLNKPELSSDESDEDEDHNNDGDGETQSQEAGFESIKRNSATLSSFKRAAGPKNRRSPSRKHRNSGGDPEMDNDVEELLVDASDKLKIEISRETVMAESEQNLSENLHKDKNHNHHPMPKPRVAFLELTNNARDIDQRVSPETSPSRSPSNSRKPFIPLLDLTTLHEHIEGQDPIPANKGQSVSYQRAKTKLNGEDGEDLHVILSPRTNKLVKRKHDLTESYTDIFFELEAPHSPSAYQTGLWSYQINVDDTPSPFEQGQAQYKKHSTGSTEDEYMKKLKQHQRKIHVLKKKIKHFEESFELEHGYKPSQADKTARPEIKKHLSDISKAKKEIKKLKEDAEMESRSRHGSGASSSGERLDPPDLPPTMDKTLDLILRRLQDKRRELCRPEDLTLMNRDQVQEEKLAVQKALLYFEGIHGRPKTKDDKDLMRPLYDRYRTIKRLMSKPMSPRFSGELKTVPEELPIELEAAQGLSKDFRNPIIVPTAEADEEEGDVLGTMDFAVTRDFSIVPESDRPIPVDRNGHSPKAKRKLDLRNDSGEVNLHEMSVPELEDELIRSKSDKKRLRRLLRNFEEEFFQKNDRKVQREDRTPLNSQYHDYKQIKAKLKLLEALLSKHHHSSKV